MFVTIFSARTLQHLMKIYVFVTANSMRILQYRHKVYVLVTPRSKRNEVTAQELCLLKYFQGVN
jgi:hypothetical protein